MPNVEWLVAHELEFPHTTGGGPPGAFPATSILDALTVNGALSGNWVTPWLAGSYTALISGGKAAASNTDGNFPAGAYWNPLANFLDGESYITVRNISLVTNGEVAVFIRTATTQATYVIAAITNDGVDHHLILVTSTEGVVYDAIITPVNGDQIGLRAQGPTIELWYAVSGVWAMQTSVSTAMLTPGRIGFDVRATDTANEFGGGAFAPVVAATPPSLHFNTPITDGPLGDEGLIFQLLPTSYKIVPNLRITDDNISQADGSALWPRWKTGLTATFEFKLMVRQSGGSVDYVPACGHLLQESWAWITYAANQLREFSTDGSLQRFLWTPTPPTGMPFFSTRRMLDEVQLAGWPELTWDDLDPVVTFTLITPFPYAIDETQHVTTITDGNAFEFSDFTAQSTSDFQPVYQVFGPTTDFTITNSSTGKIIAYDSARPGAIVIPALHYAEIDTFKGTIFMDGDGADLDPGIDPTVTDYFPLSCLTPSVVTMSGAPTMNVLWNNAYS